MWELSTGCRLHFGLMELSPAAPNRYAGLGVMLEQPAMKIRVCRSLVTQYHAAADAIDRASLVEYQQRIEGWLRQRSSTAIELCSGYPFHSGLGSGTQLACLLSLAEDLLNSSELEVVGCGNWQPLVQALQRLEPQTLAAKSGRGLRSAIGLQGFLSGGLILDAGYQAAGDQQRTIDASVHRLPTNWSFVLIRGTESSSITGPMESEMIRSLAARPNPHRQQMMDLARASIKFAEAAEFGSFTAAIDEYMQLAGDMFAPIQGGRYNGAVCSQAVMMGRDLGLHAVGQSSWGPTVFGMCDNLDQAQQIAAKIRQQATNWLVQVARTAQSGAEFRFVQ